MVSGNCVDRKWDLTYSQDPGLLGILSIPGGLRRQDYRPLFQEEMRFVQGTKNGIFNEIGWKIENWSLITCLHRTEILDQLLERPIYNYVWKIKANWLIDWHDCNSSFIWL